MSSISASRFHQQSSISRGNAHFCHQVRNTNVSHSYNRYYYNPRITVLSRTPFINESPENVCVSSISVSKPYHWPTNVDLAWSRKLLPSSAQHQSFVTSIGTFYYQYPVVYANTSIYAILKSNVYFIFISVGKTKPFVKSRSIWPRFAHSGNVGASYHPQFLSPHESARGAQTRYTLPISLIDITSISSIPRFHIDLTPSQYKCVEGDYNY